MVEEEANDSLYFLDLICEFHPEKRNEIASLYNEGNQILAMIVSPINTVLMNGK